MQRLDSFALTWRLSPVPHELVYLRSSLCPEGSFILLSEARLSPHDRGFMFADGVYEVIRTYAGRLFHPAEHLARLQQSLDFLRIPLAAASLEPVARELLQCNAPGEDAALYIQVTRGACARRLSPPLEPLTPTVYIETNPVITDPAESAGGVSCILVPDIRWQRCDIKWLGLLPNVIARQQADNAGAAEALFVRNGFVTEGTHTSLFGVKDGTVHTHPCSGSILPGITRQVVLDLCRSLAIPLLEMPIPAGGLFALTEVFLTCTTGEVIPVCALDGRPIGDGRPGPVTLRLQQAFRRHVVDYLATAE